MASIAVRKDEASRPAPMKAWEPARWDPFRMMRDLVNWDPFGEMAPFATQFPTGFVPSFEIKETKDGYFFKADVPGVKETDLEVLLTGNRLTISGKREAERKEQTETFYAYERTYGDFTRSFTLPEGADMSAVHADLKDGVLTVAVHKLPEVQPKKIAIGSPEKKS